MKAPKAATICVIFLIATNARAAMIQESSITGIEGREIVIEGEITRGDYSALLRKITESPVIINKLTIESHGGDVVEAMKIGRIVRLLNLKTVANGRCYSACFFVLVSGVHRVILANAEIGIHRPYFNKEYFVGLSAQEADSSYKKLTEQVKAYLREMNVSDVLIESMYRYSSDKLLTFGFHKNVHLLVQMAPPMVPSFEEWLIARCGKEPEDSGDFMDYIFGESDMPDDKKNRRIEIIKEYNQCELRQKNNAYKDGLKVLTKRLIDPEYNPLQ